MDPHSFRIKFLVFLPAQQPNGHCDPSEQPKARLSGTLKAPQDVFPTSALLCGFLLTSFPQAAQEGLGALLPRPLLRARFGR